MAKGDLIALRKRFVAAMGERLTACGFVDPPRKNPDQFLQETPIGHICVDVHPTYRNQGVDLQMSIGIRCAAVEDILVKSGLYAPNFRGPSFTAYGQLMSVWEKKTGGYKDKGIWYEETGAVRFDAQKVAEHIAEYGTEDGVLWLGDDDARLKVVVDRAFQRYAEFGWSIQRDHGFSEAAFLEFLLTDTPLVEGFFWLAPKRELAALILARKLGSRELCRRAVDLARHHLERAAKHGNPKPLQDYVRIGKEFGLFDPLADPPIS